MTAVIFDLDGTLIDSLEAISAIGNRLMQEMNLPLLTPEETRKYIGNGAPKLITRALAARGVTTKGEAHAERVAKFEQYYSEAPALANKPFPGAEKALRQLKAQGHVIGMCTNKPETATLNLIKALGWDDIFGCIVAGDTLPERKPDPTPLYHAAHLLKCEPDDVVYVGDSEVDAATAANAAITFAIYTEGYRKTSLEEIPHDAEFSDYAFLPSVVAALSTPPRNS